ncbi:NlpC/P60 family protein [Bailinhaonella thermotolerans]|uniref:NlpC/P60 family protein n=1 Tax=Bailinhaonella thermotolerans TaxID=1070861 RepID=A0A3A4AQW1_9ACTN|nr:NlpC/P60 family protein [Bailinhaonella thermotolerans]
MWSYTGAEAPAKPAEQSKKPAAAPAKKPAAKKKLSRAAKQRAKAAKAVRSAYAQIGDPYRYGASGPNAFDCSGLAQYVWRKAGVKLPRTTYAQHRGVKKKVSWKNLQPGDLMFFRGDGHVGIYVGKGYYIHSPSSGKKVRKEKLGGYRKRSFNGAVRPGY